MMKTYNFKTNVKCGGCIQKITPFLDNIEGIDSWKVDLTDKGGMLEVRTENIDPQVIMDAVTESGYIIEKE